MREKGVSAIDDDSRAQTALGSAQMSVLSPSWDTAASAPAIPPSSYDSASAEQLWSANILNSESSAAEELYEASGFAVLGTTDNNNNSLTVNTTEFVMASANGVLLRTFSTLPDVTTTALDLHEEVDLAEVHVDNYWGYVILLLVFATAAGNILVCLAIYLERRLQNVTNYFLMSLAITDLMVAVLVMPLGIWTLVKGE
ncbi:unnamed protein product [Ceratitis capitata]|uniref:(Mediterranean fruit fly) hypothetical protein n=1 Tax=Ceratitis capitata TaxID=7213 RepID=A0A811TX81_CERCA|nr:unnamed protein product [Ceratitis capitata]